VPRGRNDGHWNVIAWPQQAGEADEGGRGNLSAYRQLIKTKYCNFQQIASRFVPRVRNDGLNGGSQ